MKIGKAVVWGTTSAVVAIIVILIVGFVFGLNITIPSFLTLTSASSGAPHTEMWFNPLGVIGLIVVLGAPFWLIARITRRG